MKATIPALRIFVVNDTQTSLTISWVALGKMMFWEYKPKNTVELKQIKPNSCHFLTVVNFILHASLCLSGIQQESK